jgi:hypothetical protein
MVGSLAGHTAAWPLPDVTSHAVHAALHRADLDDVHSHRRGRAGKYTETRDRKFGSLLTAGPFPVAADGRWYFPRPRDAGRAGSPTTTLLPVRSFTGSADRDPWLESSLPKPLEYAVGNALPPNKTAVGEPWFSAAAFEAYLRSEELGGDQSNYLTDDRIADRERQIGIEIDPATGTTGHGAAAGKIYTAHYLRLREGFRLGLLAEAQDKGAGEPGKKHDLIKRLLNGLPGKIAVGGQQRICTAERHDVDQALPLPRGMSGEFNRSHSDGKERWLVKWILLTPAVWPAIAGENLTPHGGGWLPNWICPQEGTVLLKSGNTARAASEARAAWRTRVRAMEASGAKLVAAIVARPLPVTGWALPNPSDPDRPAAGGAKSAHLAVPAGSVYYFQAESEEQAIALAGALNWHGSTAGTEIRNRRSALLGEKGYGLGVCGTWSFMDGVGERPDK